MTGGAYIVLGPPDSMIADRNHLAVALLVSVPLMNYLRLQSRHKAIGLGMLGAIGLTLFAAIGSLSRGALIALLAMSSVFWLRSRGKITSGVALGFAIAVVIAFMPDSWVERMNTMLNYQDDGSAMGRITIWQAGLGVALMRPLTGGGFRAIYQQNLVDQIMPGIRARAAHSIWIEVLSEHGFVVFGIWLGIILTGVFYTRQIIRLARDRPDLHWATDLARMTQVAMVAFLTGGSFLSLGYWDCFWTLMAAIASARRLAVEAVQQVPAAATPDGTGWRTRAVGPPLATTRGGSLS
jgi:probable O-glycosylation ligase (exosortase A-associated)